MPQASMAECQTMSSMLSNSTGMIRALVRCWLNTEFGEYLELSIGTVRDLVKELSKWILKELITLDKMV
jgi:hypothetical protein